MADIRIFKSFKDAAGAYTLKKFAADVKKSKDYTELKAACTHNIISSLPIFSQAQYAQYKIFDRGAITKAMGDGFRFIDTYGSLQVLPFKVPEPGQELCLQVPNNIMEREETLKTVVRLHTTSKEPDILAAHDKFIDVSQQLDFTRRKIGNMAESIDLHLYLMWLWVLGTDPWSDEHAPRFHQFGIEALAMAKWDDTAITKFGYDGQGTGVKRTFGVILNEIKSTIQSEINKEKGLKNVNTFNVMEYIPKQIKKDDINKGKKLTKDAAAIQDADVNKLYPSNTETSPSLNLSAAASLLLDQIHLFTKEFTALNDANFPGNWKPDDVKKYGTEEGDDKAMFIPQQCNPENMVILMHPALLRAFKQIKTSPYIEDGAYTGAINDLLAHTIITVPTLSYDTVKLVDKNRYNMFHLYDVIKTDTLGLHLYVQNTLHRGFMFGIRQHVPAKCLKLGGIYMNPTTREFLQTAVA